MADILKTVVGDMNWSTILLAVVLVLVFYYVFKEWSDLPPGPMGIPYIGYYPFLKVDITSHLADLAKHYGEVFCFRVTGQLYIHLSSLRSIREAHITKSDCFAERPTKYSLAKVMFNDGLSFVNGESWKVLRKFFVQTLKEFGMGKSIQESVVSEGIRDTLNALRKYGGRNFDSLDLLTRSCKSTIRHLLFGGSKLFEGGAESLDKAYKKMVQVGQTKRGLLLLTGPLVRYLVFPFMEQYRRSVKNKESMETMLRKIIKEHEKTFDKHNLRDLVDFYLNERNVLRERGDPKAKMYTDSTLIHTLIQFFGDGSFAVGWLISEIMKVLANYPDVQRRIQSEIDDVIGRERLMQWGERNRLPYTTAAIYEVQRTSDILPILPSLQCTKDTTIQGHRIPKGAVTLPNFWKVHHDPELYAEQEKFDPTRFMTSKDGKDKAELPILFGVGKRSCAGEALTNMQVLMYVVAILQNFNLHPAEKSPLENGVQSDDWKILIRATPRSP